MFNAKILIGKDKNTSDPWQSENAKNVTIISITPTRNILNVIEYHVIFIDEFLEIDEVIIDTLSSIKYISK